MTLNGASLPGDAIAGEFETIPFALLTNQLQKSLTYSLAQCVSVALMKLVALLLTFAKEGAVAIRARDVVR